MAEDDLLLSRTGYSNPLGKLDDVIDTFRIDAETKARLVMLATEAGMPLMEFVRLRQQGRLV